MKLEVEILPDKQHILLISLTKSKLVTLLKTQLDSLNCQTVVLDYLPNENNLNVFQLIFIRINKISQVEKFQSIISRSPNQFVLLTENRQLYRQIMQNFLTQKNIRCKIINIPDRDANDKNIDKLLWFALTQNNHSQLNLENWLNTYFYKPASKPPMKRIMNLHLSRKQLVIYLILLFLFFEFLFIAPLTAAIYFLYRSVKSTQNIDIKSGQEYMQKGQPFLSAAKRLYNYSRPTLSFIFIVNGTDNVINIVDNSYQFINLAGKSYFQTKEITKLILKVNKTPHELKNTDAILQSLINNVSSLTELSKKISAQTEFYIPSTNQYREKINQVNQILSQVNQLTPHLPELMAKTEKKTYIIFFYNNMELRPGGGFIGSFAKVVFNKYTLEELTIYDVYDADGQLTAHVEPPLAIRKYLSQQHWFLRDSAFSPDFIQNAKTAKFFLQKELNLTDINGYIGVTTTGVANILFGFDNLYLPDEKEIINSDNFFIKTQQEIENNRFVGAQNKKNILSSIVRMMILHIDRSSPLKIASALKNNFNEKQMAVYFTDQQIQKSIDTLRWSGKLIYPRCINQRIPCISNHLFPIESNFGVNKVNYFIKHYHQLKITFNNKSQMINQYTLLIKNNSSANTVLGGDYKNYFQLYLPSNAVINNIKVDGNKVNKVDQSSNNDFTIIGFYLTVASQKTALISINYTIDWQWQPGANILQLVMQKQIGSQNNDLSLDINLPSGIKIIEQNFTAVANNNKIVYNTTLSEDRIFIIKMTK